MSKRGDLIRKALEAFPSARKYYYHLLDQMAYYQYMRNNVKGINFEPKLGGSGSGETMALAYDKEVTQINAELYRLQIFLDWVNDLLDGIDSEDESLIRERFIEGWPLDKMATTRGWSKDQVRYRIDRIIEEL